MAESYFILWCYVNWLKMALVYWSMISTEYISQQLSPWAQAHWHQIEIHKHPTALTTSHIHIIITIYAWLHTSQNCTRLLLIINNTNPGTVKDSKPRLPFRALACYEKATHKLPFMLWKDIFKKYMPPLQLPSAPGVPLPFTFWGGDPDH